MEKKYVLITGGSGGIGESIIEKLVSLNYNILLFYNNNENNSNEIKNNFEKKYNCKIDLFKVDITDEELVKKTFYEIKNKNINLYAIINNAGIAIDNDIYDKNKNEFLKVIGVNLLGTFLITKYFSKIINDGIILNVSSNNGIDCNYIESMDYDSSKAGVISLTHNFAKRFAPKIRVNCIAPGWINTPMNKNMNPFLKEKETKKILLNRFGEPKEIANLVSFLLSDEATYINDTVIRIDGGIKND